MPPARRQFTVNEAPTEPEMVVRCPACEGSGAMTILGGAKQSCDTCWGRCKLTQQQLTRYLARSR